MSRNSLLEVPMELKTSVRFHTVNMTPGLAAQLLERVHPNQRPEKPQRINKYAAEMASGRWWLNCADPAVVDEDGWLTNGRNRCKACLKAGVAVPMVICYGAPKKANVVYDTGAGRNVNDAACFAGAPLDNKQFSSVARRMAAGMRNKDELSIQQVLDYLKTYEDGIRFSFQKFAPAAGRGLMVASTRAVIARAYYTVNRERLAKFAEFLITGLPDDPKRDSAVITLRNWLLESSIPDKRRSQGGRFDRKLTYKYTEHALFNFLKGLRITQLLEIAEEQFPLPDLELYNK